MNTYKARFKWLTHETFFDSTGRWEVTNKINAIKDTRAAFGLGLKDSKDLVEKLEANVLITAEQLGNYFAQTFASNTHNICLSDIVPHQPFQALDLTKGFIPND